MNNLDKHTNWRPNTGVIPEFHDQVEELEVMYVNGNTYIPFNPENLWWNYTNTNGDIVAYRVLKWKEHKPKFKVGDTVIHRDLGRILGKVVEGAEGMYTVQWACNLLTDCRGELNVPIYKYPKEQLKKVKVVLEDVSD